MKIALVYDRVNKWGGAERVLLALHELFPKAPLYTSVYNPETAPWAKVFPRVITSFLQNFPYAKTRHDLYAPLMPLAFKSLDFTRSDLVISVTSEAAKNIKITGKTKHICYCLTPTRYLWSGYKEYFKNKTRSDLAKPIVELLKRWDYKAAQRPDIIVGISENVVARIRKYYNREAKLIYPPVDMGKYTNKHTPIHMGVFVEKDYYLVVSRLVPYKKVDIVIKAFRKLNRKLIIVGTGSEEKSLKKQSQTEAGQSVDGKFIKFVGQVKDEELALYYQNCKALIFPQEEDFGLVAVEAQAAGKPVIAYKKGGALETIIDGKTGIFFDKQTSKSLLKAVKKFEVMEFNKNDCIKNANKFSQEKFLQEFAKLTASIFSAKV